MNRRQELEDKGFVVEFYDGTVFVMLDEIDCTQSVKTHFGEKYMNLLEVQMRDEASRELREMAYQQWKDERALRRAE